MTRFVSLAICALLAASGCAREPLPTRAPTHEHLAASHGWPPSPGAATWMAEPRYAALGYATAAPPPMGGAGAPLPPAAVSRPDVPTFSSAEIPGGDACIAELTRAGVAFHRLADKRGVVTPVEVTGKVNGIRYLAGAGSSLVADCRLVLALHRIAPVLAELGVTSMRFSGAYSYRMSKVGRLSLHAHGLALDVHEVLFGTTWQSVERDYVRAVPDGCRSTSPLLNQLACRLGATRLFKELLTPDYDADHANHLHLAIASIDVPKAAEAPAKAGPVPKTVAAPKRPKKPPPKTPPRPEADTAKPPLAAPQPEVPTDDGEPTVEPMPDAPTGTIQVNRKPAKPRAQAKPKPTRPALHRPAAKPARPRAS